MVDDGDDDDGDEVVVGDDTFLHRLLYRRLHLLY